MNASSESRQAQVLVITGRTRAGKTTLARALERQSNIPATSFSSYVRAEASARGFPHDRRVLQDLGSSLISELGWEGFCRATLAHANLACVDAPFSIEGARHVATIDALRKTLEPCAVLHLHLDVSDRERNRRLALEGVSPEEGRRWEEHSTELDVVESFVRIADVVIDADLPPEEVARCAVVASNLARRGR